MSGSSEKNKKFLDELCTLLSLESLFVRSNRISMCRVTVLSLESLFVRLNRISMCRVTVLSL